MTEGVEDALEDLQPGLTGVRTDTSVFRPASYVASALDNLGLAFALGAALMLLVMLALRFHWRAVLVALVTVPLSLVVAALLLRLLGQGFNAIALVGLAAGVAVVVDEAVAPTDRVLHRLRARKTAGGSKATTALVRDASAEVRRPLTYASLLALLAIVPAAVMGGRPGDFFAPLVLAYALAVLAAMLVAVTVSPVLSVLLFAHWQPVPTGSRMLERIRSSYVKALRRFTRRLRSALVVAGVCCRRRDRGHPVPGHVADHRSFTTRDVLVRLETAPGTSNPRMTEIATELARQLKSLPGVGNVGAHVGRAVTGDRVANVSSSDVWVSIDGDADYDATMGAIDAAVDKVHGVQRDVVTYSTEKLRHVGALNGGDNPVAGDDLDLLTGSSSPSSCGCSGRTPKCLPARPSGSGT